jgi:hypothetical protein
MNCHSLRNFYDKLFRVFYGIQLWLDIMNVLGMVVEKTQIFESFVTNATIKRSLFRGMTQEMLVYLVFEFVGSITSRANEFLFGGIFYEDFWILLGFGWKNLNLCGTWLCYCDRCRSFAVDSLKIIIRPLIRSK